MIEAVVFDVGGVVTANPVGEFTKVDVEHGLPEGTTQSVFRGGADFAEVEVGRVPVMEFHRGLADRIRADHGVDVPVARLAAMLDACMGSARQPGTAELVADVKAAGYQTALLTNIWAERREWLHGLFAAGVIDVVCDSSEVGLRKPGREIYDELLRMLGRRADEVAFIDDFAENVVPAHDMGMLAIQFEDAAQTRAALVAAGVRIAPAG
jgi:epoxide hydrolase-like predicted phosphatase